MGKEALLLGPVSIAIGNMCGLVTFGAENFLDFLSAFYVEFGMLIFERIIFGPYLGWMIEQIMEIIDFIVTFIRKSIKCRRRTAADLERIMAEAAAAEAEEGREVDVAGGGSVEPILDAFNGYSGEILGLIYAPFLVFILLLFPSEIQITENYGIKDKDMFYYFMWSVVIIPFQIVCDMLMLHMLELWHGWKIYDYLVYTRYRFNQRETRWKGMEDSLDECIDEGMRTLDQMCFSGQYYLMNTLSSTGMLLMSLAVENMLQFQYNMFSDPAALIIAPLIWTVCWVVKKLCIRFALKFNVWQLKHANTSWHSNMGGEGDDEFGIPRWDELDKIKGASHEAYLMNQKITSETFRHKFLDYNRPWLVSQLPSILTPRTMHRSRPYLISQFTKILGSVNPDISSDSDSDEEDRPKFGPVALSAASRNIIRLWLAQARRRRALREVVQPLINRARKPECEQCLSRKQLQVELLIPIETLGDKFEKEFPSDEFDQVAWKNFFSKHAKFKTMCLNCLQQYKEEQKRLALLADQYSDSSDEEEAVFGPVFLN